MHAGNMRQMITQFNSDFRTLEDAGKSTYSMEDKLSKIDEAQKKCGDKYRAQFELIESCQTLDPSFTYEKATTVLIAHWNKHYDSTNQGISLTWGAPVVAAAAPRHSTPAATQLPATSLNLTLLGQNYTLDACNPVAGRHGKSYARF